ANTLQCFKSIESILEKHYTEEELQIIACPTVEQKSRVKWCRIRAIDCRKALEELRSLVAEYRAAGDLDQDAEVLKEALEQVGVGEAAMN
uniref:MerR family transcriptional regulator n=1 Tax=Macrostomum lignano TaxID=282301 RepID=A0A1I8JN70_9PLAT